jgi:uncharacterized membrane protein
MSSLKGYLWSFTFLLTAAIYGSIPSYLIVTYWRWLNALTFNGEPIYTLTLFMLFLWIVSLIITLIYLVAMVRAIIQRKNEDLGIPKGVSYFGLITVIVVIAFMIVWLLIFHQIPFFSMVSPI